MLFFGFDVFVYIGIQIKIKKIFASWSYCADKQCCTVALHMSMLCRYPSFRDYTGITSSVLSRATFFKLQLSNSSSANEPSKTSHGILLWFSTVWRLHDTAFCSFHSAIKFVNFYKLRILTVLYHNLCMISQAARAEGKLNVKYDSNLKLEGEGLKSIPYLSHIRISHSIPTSSGFIL